MKRRIIRGLLALGLVVAVAVGVSASPAAADLPSAHTTCVFGGTVLGQTNPTVAYAAYDYLQPYVARVACWTRDSVPPYVDCTFFVYYWNQVYYPNTPPTVVESGGGCNP